MPDQALSAEPRPEVLSATSERWPDLEALFGKSGGHGGCWCMFWRLKRAQFNGLGTEGRKAALRDLACAGPVPGLLAYAGGQCVGWCCVGPREEFTALENSRILKRVDDQPVWSIVCFFVARGARRQGVLRALLQGALCYAQGQGARIVEGYPLDMQTPKLWGQNLTGYSGFMGIASAYRDAGFAEVGRASETQLIMRKALEERLWPTST